MYAYTCIHLAVWLPTTAATPTAFSVERPRAPAGARVLRSAGNSLRVAVAMAGEGCERGEPGEFREKTRRMRKRRAFFCGCTYWIKLGPFWPSLWYGLLMLGY